MNTIYHHLAAVASICRAVPSIPGFTAIALCWPAAPFANLIETDDQRTRFDWRSAGQLLRRLALSPATTHRDPIHAHLYRRKPALTGRGAFRHTCRRALFQNWFLVRYCPSALTQLLLSNVRQDKTRTRALTCCGNFGSGISRKKRTIKPHFVRTPTAFRFIRSWRMIRSGTGISPTLLQCRKSEEHISAAQRKNSLQGGAKYSMQNHISWYFDVKAK